MIVDNGWTIGWMGVWNEVWWIVPVMYSFMQVEILEMLIFKGDSTLRKVYEKLFDKRERNEYNS